MKFLQKIKDLINTVTRIFNDPEASHDIITQDMGSYSRSPCTEHHQVRNLY